MHLPLGPRTVMLEATRTALRAGRFPPAEVVRRQLDALAETGYRLRPHLDDGGAALLLTAAKRAFRSGRVAPAAVVARQLADLEAAGYTFVLSSESAAACESFVWGPQSFDACARCGVSFWRHAEATGHGHGSHRRR